jgi:hypothetical protein
MAGPLDAIGASQGTGIFSSASDAMGSVGGMMESPASPKARKMKSNGKALDVTGQTNKVALETAYGADGTEIWDTLQQVQDVSDGFTHCGSFIEDALLAATRDFIRNSGIQQAGRELSKALGQYDDMLDCAAGFATLFESEGVIDDAGDIGDVDQLNNRTRTLIEDITNASSVSNMLANCSVMRGLVSEFDNFCANIMGKINDLIGKDVAALLNALNKLAQWAAFAKLATSDPCALVNSNKMLQNVTGPVMQDIMSLYDGVTGQSPVPADPTASLGDILGPPAGGVPNLPKIKQAPMTGQMPLATVAASLPKGTGVITEAQAASPTGGYDSTDPEYVNGVGWVTPNDPDFPADIEVQSDFTKSVVAQDTPFSSSNETFVENTKSVEYKAVAFDKTKVAKIHKVGWCTGGSGSGNRNEAACGATQGDWHVKEMTDNEVQKAGSVEVAMGPVAKTLADTFPEYKEGMPPSSPSSALKAGARPSFTSKSRDSTADFGGENPVVVTKERDPWEETGSFYGTWSYPNKTGPLNSSANDPILRGRGIPLAQSSADVNDPKPFNQWIATPAYGLGILPGFGVQAGGATLPMDTSTQKSNIGGDISEYDSSREVVELAMKTGDWSAVETCACQPNTAVLNAKEVGSCDFTGLVFPDGYTLVPSTQYTDNLIALVTAAEATGTGEYITGLDGEIYQSAEVVVKAKYGTTVVDPFEPGKEVCHKYSGKWYVITGAIKGSTGGSQSADIKNAKSKVVCENANGSWVCKKGLAGSTNARKQVQSYGKFTNKKNVNTRSKLPTSKAFDTDKLPSLNIAKIT